MRFNGDEIGVGTFNLMEIDDWGLYVRLKIYSGGSLIPGGYHIINRETKESNSHFDFGEALIDWNNKTQFLAPDAERHDKVDAAKDAVIEAAWQYYQVQKPLQREQLRQAIATLDELKAVQQ